MTSEFEKEIKEHPSFTNEQIDQIIKDHKKQKLHLRKSKKGKVFAAGGDNYSLTEELNKIPSFRKLVAHDKAMERKYGKKRWERAKYGV
jgi:hypothetical protein